MPFFGVCYGPYRMPNTRPDDDIPESQIAADMAAIKARGLTHIRTYSCVKGNRHNVKYAAQHGLKVGLGVAIVPGDGAGNRAAIDAAWHQATAARQQYATDVVIHVVIGNEVDRTDNHRYDPLEIRALMKYAKQSKDAVLKATVTTCFSGTVLQQAGSPWGNVVDDCDDVCYLTIYPYYGQRDSRAPATPGDISKQMNWSWDNGLRQVMARGKKIVVAEIGWPSGGGWETSPANEQANYAATKRFFSGATAPQWALDTYWFEMFDEPWKTNEGAWGAHFGLYTSGANPQPKFQF